MGTTTKTRTAVSGLGAAVLLGLCMAAPALADPAPVGGGGPTGASVVGHQGPPSYNTWGTDTVPRQGPPSYNSWPHQQSTPATVIMPTSGVHVDFAQVGAGALGGALGVGVGALVLTSTRGRRRTAHA